MTAGDHLKGYQSANPALAATGRWVHALDLGDGTVASLVPMGGSENSDASVFRISRLALADFVGGLTGVTRDSSPAAFSAEEVIDRAGQMLVAQNTARFENCDEWFVQWCRMDLRTSPRRMAGDAIERQSATLEIADPQLRRWATAASATSSADRLSLNTRAIFPWLVVADASDLVGRWISLRSENGNGRNENSPGGAWSQEWRAESVDGNSATPQQQRRAQRVGSALGSVASAMLGFAAGGPAMATASWIAWRNSKALPDNSVERIKQEITNQVSTE